MPNPAEARFRSGGLDVRKTTYSEEEIARRVMEMGEEISTSYPKGEDLLLLGLLKGSFIFMADIVRQIAVLCTWISWSLPVTAPARSAAGI